MPVLSGEALPELGVAGLKSKISPPDSGVTQALRLALKDKAAREALTEAEFKGLNVTVDITYNPMMMSKLLRIRWKDPNGPLVRCIDQQVPDNISKDYGLLAVVVEETVQNLSLRGELFFFKLAKHFPSHLKRVHCDGSGVMRVEFKNGRCVVGTEDDVENSDFVAKCAMVYDL